MLDASSSAVLDEMCTLCEADISNTRGTRSFSLLGLCTTEEFTQRICQLPHLLKDEELHNT